MKSLNHKTNHSLRSGTEQDPLRRWAAPAVVLLKVMVWAFPLRAGAEERLTLDRAQVAELVARQSPAVRIAAARVGEARALYSGARPFAQVNPELTLQTGPRFLGGNRLSVDLLAAVSWPVELSGARALRLRLADAQTRLAEAEEAEVRRTVIGEALDLWARARGLAERVTLERARAKLDLALHTIAVKRRQVGTVGDGDVALAEVIQAQGRARLLRAQADEESLLQLVRGALGIAPGAAVTLIGELVDEEVPSLEALLAHLPHRSDQIQRAAAQHVALVDERLQARLRIPVPRLLIDGGRDSNEYFARGGFVGPLPIFQRNQGPRAVAGARLATTSVEREVGGLRSEAELRAAYASYLGSLRALETLQAAAAAVDDVEHLAIRAYELGQSPLSNLVVVRREVIDARTEILDARLAAARARVNLEFAAGMWP